nr:GNAT family N-acetyltransferase [Geodermatophilus sp. Leaf369]
MDAAAWRERVTGSAWFLSHPLGLVCGAVEEPGRVALSGLWVSPTARGTGQARRLVSAVEDWAVAQGATTVVARVFDDNAAATALWTSLGFVADDVTVVSRRDPTRTWRTWSRRLPRVSA